MTAPLMRRRWMLCVRVTAPRTRSRLQRPPHAARSKPDIQRPIVTIQSQLYQGRLSNDRPFASPHTAALIADVCPALHLHQRRERRLRPILLPPAQEYGVIAVIAR